MDYKKIMEKARKTNLKHDKIDGGEKRLPLDVQINTAMAAIECGIKINSWDCVAEGQGLLEGIRDQIHKEIKDKK